MAENYRADIKDMLDKLVLDMPGVIVGKAFGYPAYKIRGKVFAFVGGDGIALKLPEKAVHDLIETQDFASPFSPAEGVVWKQWVSITHDDADDYRTRLDLIEGSAQFVGENA